MPPKTAILTNHSLRYFAGSELTTLEVARELRRRGWVLHIACFELSPSVHELFGRLEVNWIDLNKDDHPFAGVEIDLLWGHHFTTFDRLLVDYGILPKKTLFASLSPYESVECPPLYADHLSAVAANSIENFHELRRYGIDAERSFILENSVADDYFTLPTKPQPSVPHKLAVISNHVPAEVLALGDAAGQQLNIDFYGFGHKSVLITHELLTSYDLVITIGRTVQQCFALGVPVYCYDRFGGPGYVDIYNFEKAAGYNFSGRCGHRKLDTMEILAELFSGYPSAIANLATLKAMARQRFSISTNVGKALDFIAPFDTQPLPVGMAATIARQSRYYAQRKKEGGAVLAQDAPPKSDFEKATRNLFAASETSLKQPLSTPPTRAFEPTTIPEASLVRAIAFYLPQFHRIRENDQWWGEGFTEWDNVRQGKPLFDGHYQPHKPGELGYYNLDDISVLARQADMARSFGLTGFCFYYYWFDARRLLEKPVDQLLEHPEIELPFCLCWANENWTRRWDGGENEVLLKQSYSEDLNVRFAEDVARYFRDTRYIRVKGRPLFLIYRTDIIPNLTTTISAWRETWRALGIGDVYVVCVDSFTANAPGAIGCDAACEFFPHQVDFSQIAPKVWPSKLTDPEARIADYEKLAQTMENRVSPPYKRFRCVVPGWDNTSRRRKGGATLFVNSTPERYEEWLTNTVKQTLISFDDDERLIFVNAWNEWGEGCHLEPDTRHGEAYLEATRRALQSASRVDVRYFRDVLPYQKWLSTRTLSDENGKLLAEKLTRQLQFIIIVDAIGAASEALTTTLRNVASQQFVSLRIVVVSPNQSPLRQEGMVRWLQADKVPNALLLELARSSPESWLCTLRAGDTIAENGLLSLNRYLDARKHIGMAYADEDFLDPVNGPWMPLLKPDFDIDYLCSFPYVGRFVLWRGREYEELAADGEIEGNFNYMLRFFEKHGGMAVGHIAEVLFHGLPTAENEDAMTRAGVLRKHFARRGIDADIADGLLPGSLRVLYRHESKPLVSIIVPTKNQVAMLSRCIESLIEKTGYKNYEILIVDNQSDETDAKEYLKGVVDLDLPQLRVLSYPKPFNYSAMNNMAVREARGEYLVLLNNDTAVIKGDWLDALLNHALRPEVGIVGAKLLFPDGSVQHAGVILGLRGPADHPFLNSAMNVPGYMGRLQVDQQYSAVTAACLMIRKTVYEQVGGFDEKDFRVSYNDVDLCLKVKESGYSVVWTPYSLVMHVGSASQKSVDRASLEASRQRFLGEQRAMYRKWMPRLQNDPAYNRNFCLSGMGFEIERDSLFAPSMDGKAKILAHHGDEMGAGTYRVIAPLTAMVNQGLASGTYSRAYFDPVPLARIAPTSIILQRQITEVQLANIKDYHEFSSAKLIYELDDYLPNLPLASVHKSDFPKDVLRRMRAGMNLCDRVVVSTDALKHALSGMHPDIQVLPNYLPPTMWQGIGQRGELNPQRRPRVGWAGGIGHAGDLRLIVEIIKALANRVDWVFFGMLPEEARTFIMEYHPGTPLKSYPEKLASLDLDLALAPLDGGLFNECKSNLRLLEYGICGYPVIASDCAAYRCGLPVTLVKNRFKDWVASIEEKIAEPNALRKEGLALQALIQRDWMLEGKNLQQWQEGWMLALPTP